MAEIHNIKIRMPVILKKEDETKWLEHYPLKKFAYSYDVNLKAKLLEDNSSNQISLFQIVNSYYILQQNEIDFRQPTTDNQKKWNQNQEFNQFQKH